MSLGKKGTGDWGSVSKGFQFTSIATQVKMINMYTTKRQLYSVAPKVSITKTLTMFWFNDEVVPSKVNNFKRNWTRLWFLVLIIITIHL